MSYDKPIDIDLVQFIDAGACCNVGRSAFVHGRLRCNSVVHVAGVGVPRGISSDLNSAQA